MFILFVESLWALFFPLKVLKMRGAWVGSAIWDKVLNKTFFFLGAFPNVPM